jgi:hypothetical protein
LLKLRKEEPVKEKEFFPSVSREMEEDILGLAGSIVTSHFCLL